MTRRSFLEILVSAVRGAVAIIAAVPIVRFLAAPLRARAGGPDFIRLQPLSALAPGETKRVVVESDRWDAFTHYPPGPIGRVYLIREEDVEGMPKVRCLQSICPHLGCAVDQSGGGFRCPCHGAVFDENGKSVKGPAPRNMDELELRVSQGDDGESWVEVQYRTFASGTTAKRPVA